MPASQSRDSRCPQCSAEAITFDAAYGFYACSSCQSIWAYAEDDPDLDEAEGYSEVMQHGNSTGESSPVRFPQIYQADSGYWARMVEGLDA